MIRFFPLFGLITFFALGSRGVVAQEAPEDQIWLQKGNRPLEGRIVHVDADRLVIREKSRLREIDRKEVKEFSSINEDLMALMPDLRNASTALQSNGLESLAKSCEERGLPGEARLVWWSILKIEPENELAHKALGNRQSKGNWQARLSNRWWTMDKVRQEKPKWRDGFEFSTSHFDFRSNLPWFESVRAGLMAEEIYVGLYQAIGDQFGMYWPSRRMTLHLHADHTYGGGADLRATVDLDARRSSFDFEQGFQPWLFARHLNELLIAEAIWEQGDSRADLPQWMAIGMEETMQSILGLSAADSAKVDFNPDRDHAYNFSVHSAAKKPYGMLRVLNFDSGDFREADNELQRAQAYSLFAYCMHGGDGQYFPGLKSYYGLVLEGRGSSTDFRNSLGFKNKKAQKGFEQAWFEWVKGH